MVLFAHIRALPIDWLHSALALILDAHMSSVFGCMLLLGLPLKNPRDPFGMDREGFQ
jgi:hypothetical protein